MRTTKLIAALLVAGLTVAACQQDEDYVLPSITLSTPTLDFSADTEQTIDLLATRDWQILGKPDWVQRIEPDHGPGTSALQRIRLIVDANNGYNREDEIVFTIGLFKAALSISQPGAKGAIPVGTGTKEDPYTVKGVMDYVRAMASGAESPNAVYIKGKISEVAMTFAGSGTYGNANFYISDDGSFNKEKDFYCFQVYYLGGNKWKTGDEEIKVGDNVVIYGKVTNYNGNTPETTGKGTAFIYELNGVNKGGDTGGGGGGNAGTPSGTGTLADPYNAAAANEFASSLADNAKSDKDIYVKGKISKIAVSKNVEQYFTTEYGNASFYISDDGTNGESDFYCYQVLYLGNRKWVDGDTQIKVGDEVIICGKVTKYVSSYGTTPETARNEAYIYSLNGSTDGGSGSGTGTVPGNDQQGGTIFSQAFKTDGQGRFTIENKTIPNEVTAIWTYSNSYGMVATAYVSSSKINYASESWLVSPEIDLTSSTTPVLTFRHATNFFLSIDKAKEEATVWAKPTGGEWTKLSGVTYPDKLGWDFVDSGEISLSAFVGKKVQIAFKYMSTAEKAGTWEVDAFVVKEK